MIVVVGGAGYVGSVVVEDLLQRGYEVTVVDDLSEGHRQALPEEVCFYQCDMDDPSMIEWIASVHPVQALMHFAARSRVEESTSSPRSYWKNNVESTIRMLDLWVEAGVRKVIFSSSAAVYGEPETVPVSEDHPETPINPYGRTKRSLEWYLEDRYHGDNVRSVSLRYFNAAGAGARVGEDHRPETHLIPIVLEAALQQREFIQVFGTDYPTRDGSCLRDFVHVKDLSRAHIDALERIDSLGCEQINLGRGKGSTVREVIETAQDLTGVDVPVVESPRRSGDPARLIADIRRARRLLDWEPQHSLEEIVRDAWGWKRRHPRGYGRGPEEQTRRATDRVVV